jgi:hypothetical protein
MRVTVHSAPIGEKTMIRRYHAPLDPECSQVARFMDALFGDPMTHAMGAPTSDIVEDFTRKHRAKCKRCQEFGAANIEVV